jgi:hypothetical protein
MPLSLPAMDAAIVCAGKELETYDVKQESTSSMTGFIASEAGKVRAFSPSDRHITNHHGTNCFWFKEFKIVMSNNLTNFAVSVRVFVDGRHVRNMFLQAESSNECLGVYKSEHSILPFKFQELQLVGTFIFLSSEQLRLDVCQKTQTRKMRPLLLKWGRWNSKPIAVKS